MTKGRILALCWFTYASFYLLRVNISVAIPGIISEFGVSKTIIGGLMSALFGVYAIGQFVNGSLGDRFSAKKLVALGLLASAILNAAFGFSGYISNLSLMLVAMIFFWSLNGYFQSMGWAPTVKTITCWFNANERGKASGILGSCYQWGGVFSWLLAGTVIGAFGWRWGFWAPAMITVIMGIVWLILAKNRPSGQTAEPSVASKRKLNVGRLFLNAGIVCLAGVLIVSFLGWCWIFLLPTIVAILLVVNWSVFATDKLFLKDSRVWFAALALLGLNIVRYGFLSWAPTYFFEVQEAGISTAAYKAVIFPIAGSIGALTAGWLSDKIFGGRRCLMAFWMMLALMVAVFLFPYVPQSNWLWSLALLAVIGFTTYGPHVILVTTMPMDLGGPKRASSIAGFIDGCGYIGAAFCDISSGYLLQHYGWTTTSPVWYLWIGGAAFTAIMVLLLSREEKKAI